MTKTLIATLGVIGLSLLGSGANAQTFFVNGQSGGATGQWKVVLTGINSTSWHVDVLAAPTAPNQQAYTLSMRFKNGSIVDVPATSATNFGIAGAGWNNVALGGNNGFSTSTFALNNANNIKTDGSNTFSSDFTIANHTAQFLQVKVTGVGGAIWFGQGTLAPEAGAVAQFLPALLPVGLVLGRRRFLRKKAA